MGFFGDIWQWIKDQVPTWEQVTDRSFWIPSWDNLTNWRTLSIITLGAIIVGYSTGWLGSAWNFATDYIVDSWNDLWYWLKALFGWGR